jgi:lysophospholipase L1-like esterase
MRTYSRERVQGWIKSRCRTSVWILVLVLSVVYATCWLPNSPAQTSNAHWVSTWATAMQPTDAAFNNQSIRMIVRTTLGGDQVRIRLSNFYGVDALQVGEAYIGLQQEGPAIIADTSRKLTFSGQASTRIPPGAYAISDPVSLQVPQLSRLAITVFLPESTGMATGQGVGLQTTYISPAGNFTHETKMPVSSTTVAYYWVAEVFVARKAPAPLVVAFGDSITNGYKSTTDANRNWPSVLGELLLNRSPAADISVVNEGVGGNRILLPLHDPRASTALARFDRDALDHPGVSTVIFLEGINDIGSDPAPDGKIVSAADLEAGAQQIIARCHLRGIKIIGGTLVPFAGAPYFTVKGEVTRKAFNEWIRNSGAFDAVIDFDQALQDPQQTDRFLPAYDSGDHLHPGDAGYQAMAEAAARVLAK